MKLLIYGINFSPEPIGIGKYTGAMATWFSGQSVKTRVITAQPYYPNWEIYQGFKRFNYSKEVIEGTLVIRCPLYVPAEPTTLKRLLHLGSFALSSMIKVVAQIPWRPDCIVLVVPTLACALQALLIARVTGSKTVIHIQDFEVDLVTGLTEAQPGLMALIALKAERWLLRRFDYVSTISEGMRQRAIGKGVNENRLILFPNWADLPPPATEEQLALLRERFNLENNAKVVLYSGNLGEKQGLEVILDAAVRMQSDIHIRFLIVGDGAVKTRLQEMAKQRRIKNIAFFGLVSKDLFPALLTIADCHLVIQKRGAADAVLPSKLTNIFGSGGNAVVTADLRTHLGNLIENNPGLAIRVEPESIEGLAEGIRKALVSEPINEVAKAYAKKYLDKETVLLRFKKQISDLVYPDGE